MDVARSAPESIGNRVRDHVPGSCVGSTPIAARKLELDAPQAPFNGDLASLAINVLQTLIKCNTSHAPLAALACTLKVAKMRLELKYARLQLCGGRVLRLERKHGTERGERRLRGAERDLAPREA